MATELESLVFMVLPKVVTTTMTLRLATQENVFAAELLIWSFNTLESNLMKLLVEMLTCKADS